MTPTDKILHHRFREAVGLGPIAWAMTQIAPEELDQFWHDMQILSTALDQGRLVVIENKPKQILFDIK